MSPAATAALQTPQAPSQFVPESSSPSILSKAEDYELSGIVDQAAPDRGLTRESIANSPRRTFSTLRWALILIATYTTCFLYGLDNTIVADIQGAVVTTFDEVDKLSWLGSGFPLGGLAVILALGKLYSTFGSKYIYIGTIVLFEIGSAICGAAPTMNALIIGRVLGGMGAAGMYLGTLNLIATFTTLKERPIYMGVIGLVWGAGTILGPVIGGSFADSRASWRWAFYINIVILGAMAPIFFFYIPNVRLQPDALFGAKLASLDWVGMVLNIGIYIPWVLALQLGGSTWSWGNGGTIACLVVTGLLVVMFGAQQYFSFLTDPNNRIFPVNFLKRRTLILLYITSSAINAAIFMVIFYIPVYFQFAHNDNGIDSAVRLLPFVITLVVCNLLNSFTMPNLPYYLPWYLFSGLLITAGGAMLYTITSTSSLAFIYGATAMLGIGSGATINAAYTVAAAKVQPEEVGDALAFMNIAQIGGIMHALAISGAVYQNVASSGLHSVFDAAGLTYSSAQISSAVAGSRSVVFAALALDVRALAIDAIITAIQRVWVMVIAAGALAAVLSFAMRWERLVLKVVTGG